MDQPIELIPLVCTRCNTRLPAEVDEVAWACAQCGQGLLLDETKGLIPLTIHYSHLIQPNGLGRPFWVAPGQVTLGMRETWQGNQLSEAQRFWSKPQLFCIPAFNASLEEQLSIAGQLLIQPPGLQDGPPTAFVPVSVLPEEIKAVADFVVMAVEAGRNDKLKRFDFTLALSAPALWILP